LLKIVPANRFAIDSRSAIKIGASGDTTYPFDKAAEEIILSKLKDMNESFSIISEELPIFVGADLRVSP